MLSVGKPLFLLALLASVCLVLLGAVPAHVQTADYFAGYAGTRRVAPQVAARWLTWAEVNVAGSIALHPLGVKTFFYTDPFRTMAGDPEFSNNEADFAHDCAGNRIEAAHRSGQYLMSVKSPSLLTTWKNHVARYAREGRFNAILADDANNLYYLTGRPCEYDPHDWLERVGAMQRAVGFPVIYNALSGFSDRSVSPSIALNRSAIGGMMEECYQSHDTARISGDSWYVAEATELQMMRARKYFFCYGNDTRPATDAIGDRLYVYASFLLTYDPRYAVLWEYYDGPSHFHVMPETQLVPSARGSIASIDALRIASGVYERRFDACFVGGRAIGACAVAVNPDSAPHALDFGAYRRTLTLAGGGAVDGGSIRIESMPPPGTLQPQSAVIAFK